MVNGLIGGEHFVLWFLEEYTFLSANVQTDIGSQIFIYITEI